MTEVQLPLPPISLIILAAIVIVAVLYLAFRR
jgi:hypothetical protein